MKKYIPCASLTILITAFANIQSMHFEIEGTPKPSDFSSEARGMQQQTLTIAQKAKAATAAEKKPARTIRVAVAKPEATTESRITEPQTTRPRLNTPDSPSHSESSTSLESATSIRSKISYPEIAEPLSKLPANVTIHTAALTPNAIVLHDPISGLEIVISKNGRINKINGNKASGVDIMYELEKELDIHLSDLEKASLIKAFENKTMPEINTQLAEIAKNHGKTIYEANLFNAIKKANTLSFTSKMANKVQLRLVQHRLGKSTSTVEPNVIDSPITLSGKTRKKADENQALLDSQLAKTRADSDYGFKY